MAELQGIFNSRAHVSGLAGPSKKQRAVTWHTPRPSCARCACAVLKNDVCRRPLRAARAAFTAKVYRLR